MITAQTAMQIYKLYSNMSYHHPIIYILIHPTALTTEITNQLTEFLL